MTEYRGRYFGKMYTAPVYFDAEQVPVPLGEPCVFCNEPCVEGDDGFLDILNHALHRECQLRAAVGSITHQLRLCSCYLKEGALDEAMEEQGITKREAARRAMNFFFERL